MNLHFKQAITLNIIAKKSYQKIFVDCMPNFLIISVVKSLQNFIKKKNNLSANTIKNVNIRTQRINGCCTSSTFVLNEPLFKAFWTIFKRKIHITSMKCQYLTSKKYTCLKLSWSSTEFSIYTPIDLLRKLFGKNYDCV